MKKRKYKINYKKIIRNMSIITFIVLSIKVYQIQNANIKKGVASYESYIEYVKNNNLPITQETYSAYLKK